MSSRNTIAALDLGGGSTQVTFAPHDVHKTPLLNKYLHVVSTQKTNVEVFTNSYLHLGLQAMRHAVMTHGNPDNTLNLTSECVNPIVKHKPFRYAKTVFSVT